MTKLNLASFPILRKLSIFGFKPFAIKTMSTVMADATVEAQAALQAQRAEVKAQALRIKKAEAAKIVASNEVTKATNFITNFITNFEALFKAPEATGNAVGNAAAKSVHK